MLRAFSPTGFNVIFPEIKRSESRIYMIVFHYRRGEWHSPSHDTGTFPYFRNNFTSLSGHPTPLGFNVNSPAVTLR